MRLVTGAETCKKCVLSWGRRLQAERTASAKARLYIWPFGEQVGGGR